MNKQQIQPPHETDKTTLVPKLRFPEFQDAEVWTKTTVGKITDAIITGGTPSTSERNFWGGEIRWMNSGELNDKKVYEVKGRITLDGLKNSSTKLIPPRCVLIGLAGQGKTRGTVAINLVDLCINQSIAAIFPKNSTFFSEFLYHELDRRYDELRRLSSGGEGRGGLNLQIIKSLNMALPSLPEQQRIADCLSSLDALIAAQARKVDALKTHKKGLMQQLFPRDGETQPRLRFPKFLGNDWKRKELKDVAPLQRGFDLPSDLIHPGNIPIVYSNGIQKYHETGMATAPGLVTGRSGTIGKLHFIEHGEYWPHNTSLWVTDFKGNAPKFVYFLFQSIGIERFSSGSGVPTLNRNDVHSFFTSVPSLAEQQRIADCLSSLDAVINAATQRLAALKTHKQGLMQQLFPTSEDATV
jgi:restriction endonuclease S subunit